MVVLFVTNTLITKTTAFEPHRIAEYYSNILKQFSVHHIFVTQGTSVEFYLHVQKITLDSDSVEELLDILNDIGVQYDLKWRGQGLRFDIVKSVDN